MYPICLIVFLLTTLGRSTNPTVTGLLLNSPVDTIAHEGETVQLICQSNLTTSVKWIVVYPASLNVRAIFEPDIDQKGYIYYNFRERFSCMKQHDGYQNLVIQNVRASDTGKYTCIENLGFGYSSRQHSRSPCGSANLTVIERTSFYQTTLHSHSNVKAKATVVHSSTYAELDWIVFMPVFLVILILSMLSVVCMRRHCQLYRNGRQILSKGFRPLLDRRPDEANGLETRGGGELAAASFLNKSRLLRAIPFNGPVTGITVLNYELFVVREASKNVGVYNINNYSLVTRIIAIRDSLLLRAIVASPWHKCLYISDIQRKVIYRYNLSNNVISNWSVGGQCWGLSLTTTDNVLVTLFDTKHIEEYSPDGGFLRCISLDKSMEGPRHAIQLADDRFVVSHGFTGPAYRVCIVNMSGCIIQSYGGAQWKAFRQLNNPSYLAVDRYGNVLVADWWNDRVVLLSSSLNYIGHVTVPGHKLNLPSALHLDPLNQRLYIGEWNIKGCIFILGVDHTV